MKKNQKKKRTSQIENRHRRRVTLCGNRRCESIFIYSTNSRKRMRNLWEFARNVVKCSEVYLRRQVVLRRERCVHIVAQRAKCVRSSAAPPRPIPPKTSTIHHQTTTEVRGFFLPHTPKPKFYLRLFYMRQFLLLPVQL